MRKPSMIVIINTLWKVVTGRTFPHKVCTNLYLDTKISFHEEDFEL